MDPWSIESKSAFRLPAEWEPHEATWLIWPGHARAVSHWHGHEQHLRRFLLSYAEQLSRAGPVCLLVGSSMPHRPDPDLPLATIESDDIWLRDTAPTFLLAEASEVQDNRVPGSRRLRALCPRWSAYGDKYQPSQADAALAPRLAQFLCCDSESLPFVLEGGAIETDGCGTLLASTGSIVHEARNPGCSQADLETSIRLSLGVQRVVWIDACLRGDDTDGHVDQLVRFVAPGRAVVAAQPDPTDANYAVLQRLWRHLGELRDAHGRSLELIPINLPAHYFVDGEQLPASYLNFYIANHFVFVPTFDSPFDGPALTTLSVCFPKYKVVPIDCRLLVRGRGGLHCISRQQPKLPGPCGPCQN